MFLVEKHKHTPSNAVMDNIDKRTSANSCPQTLTNKHKFKPLFPIQLYNPQCKCNLPPGANTDAKSL